MKANPTRISELLFAVGSPLPPWAQNLISEEKVSTVDVRFRGQSFLGIRFNEGVEADFTPGENTFNVRRPQEQVICGNFDDGKTVALVKDGKKVAQILTCFHCWKKSGRFIRILDSSEKEEIRLFACIRCGHEWRVTFPPSKGKVANTRKKHKSYHLGQHSEKKPQRRRR